MSEACVGGENAVWLTAQQADAEAGTLSWSSPSVQAGALGLGPGPLLRMSVPQGLLEDRAI